MSYEDGRCGCFWENLPYCTRGLGVATAVVLWGVGVDMAYHQHTLGIYILNETSRALGCWSGVLWLDTWKKSLLYWAAATAILVRPHRLWLTTVSGGLLIALGIFHLLLVYKKKLEAKEALLEAREDSYDRYEDEMEPAAPEGVNTHTDSDTPSTHDYILQV